MSDKAYVARLGKLYDQIMSLRNDDDYVINQPQMDRLVEVVSFFLDLADSSSDGHVKVPEMAPREEHGGVTATFLVFDVAGEMCQKFSKIISFCSAVSIDALTSGEIRISVTVPNVFMHK